MSQDIQFSGNPSESYENYQNLSTFFLEKVLPAASDDLSAPQEELDELTTIQFAASTAFDQWFRKLAPNKAAAPYF